MRLGDRIRLERNKNNLSQAMLGKILNVSQQAIGKWEKNIAEPDTNALSKLSEVFNVSVDYLLGRDEITAKNLSPETIVDFQIIGKITAGYNGIAIEDKTDEIQEVPSSILKGRSKSEFMVLRVSGDSMYPQFLDGDRVLVERCTSVDSGSIAIVLYNGDEATIKQVRYEKNCDWVELIPRNPEYPTKRISGADLQYCRVLGKVVYLFRKI